MGLRNRFVPKKKYSGKPKWKVRGTFPVSKSIHEAIRNKHKQHRQWMVKKGGIEADLARLTYTKASNKGRNQSFVRQRVCLKKVLMKNAEVIQNCSGGMCVVD